MPRAPGRHSHPQGSFLANAILYRTKMAGAERGGRAIPGRSRVSGVCYPHLSSLRLRLQLQLQRELLLRVQTAGRLLIVVVVAGE